MATKNPTREGDAEYEPGSGINYTTSPGTEAQITPSNPLGYMVGKDLTPDYSKYAEARPTVGPAYDSMIPARFPGGAYERPGVLERYGLSAADRASDAKWGGYVSDEMLAFSETAAAANDPRYTQLTADELRYYSSGGEDGWDIATDQYGVPSNLEGSLRDALVQNIEGHRDTGTRVAWLALHAPAAMQAIVSQGMDPDDVATTQNVYVAQSAVNKAMEMVDLGLPIAAAQLINVMPVEQRVIAAALLHSEIADKEQRDSAERTRAEEEARQQSLTPQFNPATGQLSTPTVDAAGNVVGSQGTSSDSGGMEVLMWLLEATLWGVENVTHVARAFALNTQVALNGGDYGAAITPYTGEKQDTDSFAARLGAVWQATGPNFVSAEGYNELVEKYGDKGMVDLALGLYEAERSDDPEAMNKFKASIASDPRAVAEINAALGGQNLGDSVLAEVMVDVYSKDQGNYGNLVMENLPGDAEPGTLAFAMGRDAVNVASWFVFDPLVWAGVAGKAFRGAKYGIQVINEYGGLGNVIRAERLGPFAESRILGRVTGRNGVRAEYEEFGAAAKAWKEADAVGDVAKRDAIEQRVRNRWMKKRNTILGDDDWKAALEHELFTAEDWARYFDDIDRATEILKGRRVALQQEVSTQDQAFNQINRAMRQHPEEEVLAHEGMSMQVSSFAGQAVRRGVYMPHETVAKATARAFQTNFGDTVPKQFMVRAVQSLDNVIAANGGIDAWEYMTADAKMRAFNNLMSTDEAFARSFGLEMGDWKLLDGQMQRTIFGRWADRLYNMGEGAQKAGAVFGIFKKTKGDGGDQYLRVKGWKRNRSLFNPVGKARGMRETWSRLVTRLPNLPNGLDVQSAKHADEVYRLSMAAGMGRGGSRLIRSAWISGNAGSRQNIMIGLVRSYTAAMGLDAVDPHLATRIVREMSGLRAKEEYAATAIPNEAGVKATLREEVKWANEERRKAILSEPMPKYDDELAQIEARLAGGVSEGGEPRVFADGVEVTLNKADNFWVRMPTEASTDPTVLRAAGHISHSIDSFGVPADRAHPWFRFQMGVANEAEDREVSRKVLEWIQTYLDDDAFNLYITWGGDYGSIASLSDEGLKFAKEVAEQVTYDYHKLSQQLLKDRGLPEVVQVWRTGTPDKNKGVVSATLHLQPVTTLTGESEHYLIPRNRIMFANKDIKGQVDPDLTVKPHAYPTVEDEVIVLWDDLTPVPGSPKYAVWGPSSEKYGFGTGEEAIAAGLQRSPVNIVVDRGGLTKEQAKELRNRRTRVRRNKAAAVKTQINRINDEDDYLVALEAERQPGGRLNPAAAAVNPAMDANGKVSALYVGQTSDYIAVPNIKAMDQFAARQSFLNSFLFQGTAGTNVTEAWVLGSLYGPRFAIRNAFEDIAMYVLTGGKLGKFWKGRRLDEAIDASMARVNREYLAQQQRFANAEREYERVSKLFEKGQADPNDLARAKTELDRATTLYNMRRNERDLFGASKYGQHKKRGIVRTAILNMSERLSWTAAGHERDTIPARIARLVAPTTSRAERVAALEAGEDAMIDLAVKSVLRQNVVWNRPGWRKIVPARAEKMEDLTPRQLQYLKDEEDFLRSSHGLQQKDAANEAANHLMDGSVPTLTNGGRYVYSEDGKLMRRISVDEGYQTVRINDNVLTPVQARGMMARLGYMTDNYGINQAAMHELPEYWKALNAVGGPDIDKINKHIDVVLGFAQGSRDWAYVAGRFRLADDLGAREHVRRMMDDMSAAFTKRNSKDGDLWNQELWRALRVENKETGKVTFSVEGVSEVDFLEGKFATPSSILVHGSEGWVDVPAKDMWSAGMWNQMGRSMSRMSRSPIFYSNYLQSREAFRPAERMWAEVFGEEYARKRFAEAAAERAYELTMSFVDNPAIRSNISWQVRNIARYYRAQEDFVRRVMRMVKFDPVSIQKANLAWQAQQDFGFVHRDNYGNDYFMYPGSAAVMSAFQTVMGVVGIDNLKFAAAPMAFSGNVQWLSPSLDLGSAAPTMSSPWMAVTLQPLLREMPFAQDFFKAVERVAFGDVSSNMDYTDLNLGDNYLEATGSAMYQTLPPVVKKVVSLYESASGNYLPGSFGYKMTSKTVVAMAAAGQLPSQKDIADPRKRREFLDLMGRRTVEVSLLSLIFGLAAPASPQYAEDTLSMSAREQGLTALAPGLREGIMASVRNGDSWEEAYIKWMSANPSQAGVIVSSSESIGGAYVEATFANVDFIKSNMALFEEAPVGVTFFVPDERGAGGGEEGQAAWRAMKAFDLREYRELRDVVDQVLMAEGKLNKTILDGYITDMEATVRHYDADGNVTDEWRRHLEEKEKAYARLNDEYASYDQGYELTDKDEVRVQADQVVTANRQLRGKSDKAAMTADFIDAYTMFRGDYDRFLTGGDASGIGRDEMKERFKEQWQNVVRLFWQDVQGKYPEENAQKMVSLFTRSLNTGWRDITLEGGQ